jgi:hypothetical protein
MQACQAAQDRDSLVALLVPLLAVGALIVSRLRTPADAEAGEAQAAVVAPVPETDKDGEAVYSAEGFTPFVVNEGAPGVRLRVDVGTINLRSPRCVRNTR